MGVVQVLENQVSSPAPVDGDDGAIHVEAKERSGPNLLTAGLVLRGRVGRMMEKVPEFAGADGYVTLRIA